MNRSQRLLSSLLFTILVVVGFLPTAAHAIPPHIITKVPIVISAPGIYVLSKSFGYAGVADAISIQSDDVVLDLAGHVLTATGLASLTSETAGVHADSHSNVTIRNGVIRGFYRAVYLLGGSGHLIENVRADQSTYIGFHVAAGNSILRNNRITSVGGSTIYPNLRCGMLIYGPTIQVLDNTVVDVKTEAGGGNAGVGIYVSYSDSALISGNRILFSASTLSLTSKAIDLEGCGWCSVSNNQMSGGAIGVLLNGGGQNLYRDNTATRAFTGYSNVGNSSTDGGGNK